MHCRLAQEMHELEENITNIDNVSQNNLKKGIGILERSQSATEVYFKKSNYTRRKIINDLFEDIYLDGKTRHVKYNPYVKIISKKVEEHRYIENHFRTGEESSFNSGNVSLSDALRTVWRARPDSNRRSPP